MDGFKNKIKRWIASIKLNFGLKVNKNKFTIFNVKYTLLIIV